MFTDSVGQPIEGKPSQRKDLSYNGGQCRTIMHWTGPPVTTPVSIDVLATMIGLPMSLTMISGLLSLRSISALNARHRNAPRPRAEVEAFQLALGSNS